LGAADGYSQRVRTRRPVVEPLERYTVDGLLARDAEIRVMRPELRRVDVHWHDFYELVFVLSGTARHVLNGETYEAAPGTVFLLTPTDFHELHATTDHPLTCYNVVIDPLRAERCLDDLVPSPSSWLPCVVPDFAAAEPDFSRLWSESVAGRPGAAALMESVLRCILIELARRSDRNEAGSAPDRLADARGEIRRAVVFVDRHFREPLTLAEVAAQAHLSPNYFSERFRQSTGTSFQGYLQQRRLRFAHSLLASTELGVTAICHAAGFNNPSHFGRAYRRHYGQSPSGGRAFATIAHPTADATLSSLDKGRAV
jgi:AraC-like DNA-binding protein/mannose-6-phosphate isomerase-like protein (cupin superfamily)